VGLVAAPCRRHDDKERLASLAGGSRQGAGVLQTPQAGTGPTGQPAAASAVRPGRRLSTDSASRSRARQGSRPDDVNHTQKDEARGDVPENRAAGWGALLKPSRRVWRGRSTTTRPGERGFLPCLRTFQPRTAGEQTARIVAAALAPAVARRARKGDVVRGLDHYDLLHSPIN
jgi:hypothetical protein